MPGLTWRRRGQHSSVKPHTELHSKIVDLAESLVKKKLAELQQTIDLRRQKGLKAALQIVGTDRGKQIMDEIRKTIASLQNTENKLLQERSQESQATARTTILTFCVGICLNFTVLSVLYYLIYREMAVRQQAEIALHQAREKLEVSVQEITAELATSNAALQQTATELQKQTSILQSILNSMGSGVLVADREGKFLLFNRAGQRLHGMASPEITPDEWSEQYGLFLPDAVTQYPPGDLPLARALRGEEVDDVELCIRNSQKPDGVWIVVNARPLRDETGMTMGGVIVFHDITLRKQTEEVLRQSEAQLREQATQLTELLQELKKTQSQLVQTEKMSSLGQLVAGVAHEINNPVNFIYGNLIHASEYTQELVNLLHLYQQHYPQPVPEIEAKAESIDVDFLVEDLPQMLGSMKIGADRIRQIVLSLRNFSRLDEAEMKQVDIHEGLDNTLVILNYRLKPKPDRPGIQVIQEYGQLPLVECYPGQLNQVFMNILTNAIDALDEYNKQRTAEEIKLNPATIRISTAVIDRNQVTIRIADNGLGMTEEVRNKLFDPFFTTKPVGKGTGLGLAISYQIVVEKHGGALKYVSEVGQGTEFSIEIPVYAQRFSKGDAQLKLVFP